MENNKKRVSGFEYALIKAAEPENLHLYEEKSPEEEKAEREAKLSEQLGRMSILNKEGEK